MSSNRDFRWIFDSLKNHGTSFRAGGLRRLLGDRVRLGLVVCVAGGMALSGCAGGGWSRLVGKKKDEPPANLTLAWAKYQENEGKLTEARTGYEKVLAEKPDSVDALLGLSRMNVKAQRLVEAEKGYAQAMKLQPKSPAVLSEVGQFYAQQQRWDKAIPLLQDAQRIEPHEKSHQYTLAVALTKAGRTADALPHFTEAVGEAAAHYNVGRMLIEEGHVREAEEQFALALAKDPKLDDAEYFLNEIRSGQIPAMRGAMATIATPVDGATQQVSGTASSRRSTVTPANLGQPGGRPPLYPHVGYEELPPPPEDGVNEARQDKPSSASGSSGIVQISGFSAPDSGRVSQATPQAAPQLVPPSPTGRAQLRMSSTATVQAGK